MQNISILWEGELPLEFIKWNKKSVHEFKLPPKHDSELNLVGTPTLRIIQMIMTEKYFF
jgi:hypothetical protein